MRTWNLITTVLVAGLIAGATAACDGGSAATTSVAAPPPTARSAPASPAPSPARTRSHVSKAEYSGSQDPRSGTQYAILKSSELSTRRITYDLIEWYDGEEAVRACAEDGEKPAENDYCVGYYIRNNNKKLRTLTVDPDASIRVMVLGEMKPVDLSRFLSEIGNGNVIRFDIDANRITKLEHVYLP